MDGGSENNPELEELRPEDRRPGEPVPWYERRLRFLRMGSSRSVRKLWLEERDEEIASGKKRHKSINVSSRWYEVVDEWRWRELAREWDKERLKDEAEAWEAERKADKAARIKGLKAGRAKLLRRIVELNPVELTGAQAIDLLLKLNKALAGEYNDTPTHLVQLEQGGAPGDKPVKRVLAPGEVEDVFREVMGFDPDDDFDDDGDEDLD